LVETAPALGAGGGDGGGVVGWGVVRVPGAVGRGFGLGFDGRLGGRTFLDCGKL
jgi:hypothetical protein